MKKSILNLGKTLNKVEQKRVQGGMVILRCSSGNCYSDNWVSGGTSEGDTCAVLFGYGDYCRGVINNNECCIN
ncbi:hypothetical protein P8625_06940 [Tenacibaculum tangerinum]|uniref:Natural product n=1 Tax=Tenacibaculum tangerinum TaxID=3038772 RepID=A0ABY8L644_9FLAO|nr:hypothetical protein [Tenacibaculum tangerinum]WGH76872.1 hypothetical protein P8625_06940 [Tenacibaculum tangerinum]